MAVITSGKAQSAHWYHRDGTPQHTVPLAKGDGERPTHLGDARKLGLYPSVSGIIGILDKPGLMTWKLKQMVEFALRTPRAEGVSDAHYFDMVKDAAFQQVEDAAEFGTTIHNEIEKFLRWDFTAQPIYPTPPELKDYVGPVINWMWERNIKILSPEKVLVNHQHGFAGTSDAPYRATKSFGILDYKTNRTKPNKSINEYPEKILQLAAYFATYWGEAAIENQQAWVGNIYISSTEKGRTVAIMYNYEAIKRAWEVFKMLCYIWRDRNEYDPRLTITTQPKWTTPVVIEISDPANPTIGGTTAELVAVAVPPIVAVESQESPNVQSLQTNQSLPIQDSSPSSDVLNAKVIQDEIDGIKFLSPAVCKNWKKTNIPTIYSWWHNPSIDTARVGFSADGALMQTGWVRCFKAYAADINMENRAAGKDDPDVGTSNIPIKPADFNISENEIPKPSVAKLAPKIPKPPVKLDDELAAAPGSPERINQLERMKMGFGKYRRDTLVSVPTAYFVWCLGEIAAGRFAGTEHVKEYLSIDSVVKAIDMDAK